MRTDPGRDLQDAAIAAMDVQARGRERLRLSTRGRLLAWAQADAAGPMSELERCRVPAQCLYPGCLPLRSVRSQGSSGSTGAWRLPAEQAEHREGRLKLRRGPPTALTAPPG
jgi:hypothetical protein